MKTLILGILLSLTPALGFAKSLNETDLTGSYSLSGNSGFLEYDLTFNPDGSANLAQTTIDGSPISCIGRYKLNSETLNLLTIYHCEAGDLLSQETNLRGISAEDLLRGVNVSVQIKSSLGTDTMLPMLLKKK